MDAALFDEVFDALIGPVLIVELAGLTVLRANAAAEDLYLYPPGTLTGTALTRLAADPARAGDFLRQHKSFVPLRYVKRSDGQHVPVEMRVRYMERDGEAIVVLALHELTQRMQEQQRDATQEQKYRAVFEAAPYPILIVASNGQIVDGNPCAVALYGYSRDAWAALSLAQLIPDNPSLGAQLVFARPTRLAAMAHQRIDGSRFVAETTISYLRLDQQAHAILMVDDVTEAHETLLRLQAAEERWRFALEGADDEVWDWHVVRGEVEISSHTKSAAVPSEPSRTHEAEWMARVHPEDQLVVRMALDRALQGETELFSIEFRLVDAERGYRWRAARGKVVSRDLEGRAQRMIGTFRDVHDQRLQAEQARLRETELTHAGRLILLGEMASVLAHEINQPLTALNNFSTLCLRRLERLPRAEAESIREPLGLIRDQARRAGEIVHRVRGFVRKGSPRPSDIDLNALILRMLNMTSFELRAHSVKPVLELDDALPDVRADRLQMEQVVVNLIRNAVDAMREIDRPRRLTISTRRSSSFGVEVAVGDVGPGIDEEDRDRVFELFRTTKPDGLGLGLSICRSIIEAHGGLLRVESGRPQGVEFVFALPVQEKA